MGAGGRDSAAAVGINSAMAFVGERSSDGLRRARSFVAMPMGRPRDHCDLDDMRGLGNLVFGGFVSEYFFWTWHCGCGRLFRFHDFPLRVPHPLPGIFQRFHNRHFNLPMGALLQLQL